MSRATAKAYNFGVVKRVKQSDYSNAKIIFTFRKVKVDSVLPFRVKFSNTDAVTYGPGNAAPIGIAIVGLNNYVM
jgi:hypothetical protein